MTDPATTIDVELLASVADEIADIDDRIEALLQGRKPGAGTA
jgi:hypothetical protein